MNPRSSNRRPNWWVVAALIMVAGACLILAAIAMMRGASLV
jgi:hypothetical protein